MLFSVVYSLLFILVYAVNLDFCFPFSPQKVNVVELRILVLC